MSEFIPFVVGEKVQVGTAEHLPHDKLAPIYGRVICVDAINNHGMSVIALVQENGDVDDDTETMRQFSEDGLTILALNAAENSSKTPESNLYHLESI